MKKVLIGLMVLGMILGISSASYAYETASVTLNGQYIQFDQQPIIINDRTMVPMRKIFEAMGCEVLWYEEDEMIDVWRGDDNLMTLWIGDPEMWTPGGLVYLDAAPFVMNDRTLVPVRAISESIGARVDWNEYTWTVIITYNGYDYNDDYSYTDYSYQNTECSHSSTRQSISIDEREYRDIGDPVRHNYIDKLVTFCNICNKEIDVSYINGKTEHVFNGNICIDCGYEKEPDYTSGPSYSDVYVDTEPSYDNSSSAQSNRPSSSGSVSEYIDGAFMNITVPAGASICVPNTSGSTLNVKMDGVYNAFERKSDGYIDTQTFNKKDKSGSITISKGAEAIIENSGNGDLVVSIPSEYAEYSVTYEKVYETVLLSRGESVKLETINDQSANFYANNSDYRIIKYDPGKNSISTTSMDASSSNGSVGKTSAVLITANSSLELHYCPALISCARSASGFREMTLSNGDTIRLTASSNSKMVIYTEGGQEYDYVEYNSKGTAGTPRKGIKTKSQTINKGCYADFTNTSGGSMTVYVTDLYGGIEYR